MTVVGMGNPEMGDDGIGVILAQNLRGQVERGTWSARPDILVAARDPVLVGACLAEGARVLLVDAVDMKGEPGDCRMFSPAEADFTARPSASTHTLSLGGVIELARGLGCADRLRIMGVQLGDAGPGRSLSPRVREKIPQMLERIKEEVERTP